MKSKEIPQAKNKKVGKYVGDCLHCGMMLMAHSEGDTYEGDMSEHKKHTDKVCPGCGKRVAKQEVK